MPMKKMRSIALYIFLSLASPCAVCAEAASDLEAQFKKLNDTLWAKEDQAQRYEATFFQFWDDLRAATDKIEAAKTLHFDELTVGTLEDASILPWNLKQTLWKGSGRTFTYAEWIALLDQFKADGFQLVETEWHQPKFDIDDAGQASSTINMLLHVTRPARNLRLAVRAQLQVSWSKIKDANGNFVPSKISVSDMKILERQGRPPFANGISWQAKAMGKSPAQLNRASTPEPIIAYDLDRDGLPEIIVAGWNMIFWNRGNGRFDPKVMLPDTLEPILAAVVADFTGDGLPDIIIAPMGERLYLYRGVPGGGFAPQGEKIMATPPLKFSLCLCAGDPDGDGALDLFVTQYRMPYVDGNLPAPYYDANDGNPSFMLKNDGNGNFSDITEASGLAKKRNRRTYSASFVDLDDDGHQDLVVVSDYCGLDIYHNDGKGHFIDASDKAVDESRFFGMGHTLGDYNLDGKLHLYVIGMSSTTARRLEHMKLGRADLPEHTAMRMKMGFGNRMYMGGENFSFPQPEFKESIAHTGWSYGSTTFDFDNDGAPDIFVANGFQSGKSSRDFCTQFWRHDIYLSSSGANKQLDLFLKNRLMDQELAKQQISWNGFEHKFLQMNLGGKDFVNVAFPMDVAYEFDARAVVSTDLNNDGKVDLLVTEWGWETDAAVHVIVNRGIEGNANNWCGVQLREEGKGYTPVGAKITVSAGGRKQIARVVTGDSYRAQHAPVKHFGLGKETQVDYFEVQWANGKTARVNSPKINQYLYIKPDLAK